jgi:hypothetical protein
LGQGFPSQVRGKIYNLGIAVSTIATKALLIDSIGLVTANTTEGAAYGAALLANFGAGSWESIQAAYKKAAKITASMSSV